MESREEVARVPASSSKPLDQEVWRAWQEKHRLRDERKAVTRMKAVKWVCIAILLITALFFVPLAPYHVWVRFAIALGACVVLGQGLHTRQYGFAVLFTVLVLLYNPLIPVFAFSGSGPRGLVLASTLPFLASLVGRKAAS